MLTVSEARRQLARRFSAAGIESAALDARLLMEHVTGLSIEELTLHPERRLMATETTALETCEARRMSDEPVSRIVGLKWFYGRAFEVSEATLDPRPESETLIDVALELIAAEGLHSKPFSIVDIGTGTGCLLLTLLAEFPAARGVGTDVSSSALQVAGRNARRLGVDQRARFVFGRGFGEDPSPANLVISNPPYIPTAEIAELPRAVRGYDPLAALDGGCDGLDVYKQIVRQAVDFSLDAWFVMEVGATQAEAVREVVMAESGSNLVGGVRVDKDLSGSNRCVSWKTHF